MTPQELKNKRDNMTTAELEAIYKEFQASKATGNYEDFVMKKIEGASQPNDSDPNKVDLGTRGDNNADVGMTGSNTK